MAKDLKNLYKTCNLEEAKSLVRKFESRGDFNYSGIGKLFEIVEKMTSEFWMKHTLPSTELLIKSSQLSEEQLTRYLKTMILTSVPLIKKITIVEKDPAGYGSNIIPTLMAYDVFCFPSEMDKASSKPYFKEYNRRSAAILGDYFKKDYVKKSDAQIKELLLNNISNQNYLASFPQANIEKLFESPLNINSVLRTEHKDTIIKPVIKKLIDNKILYYAKNETGESLAFDSVLLINSDDELVARFNCLSEYFHENILSPLVDNGHLDQSDIIRIQDDSSISSDAMKTEKLLEMALPYKEKLSDINFQILSELIITSQNTIKIINKKEEDEKRQKIDDIISVIRESHCLIDLNKHKFDGEQLNEDLIRGILNNPDILSVNYAINKKIG